MRGEHNARQNANIAQQTEIWVPGKRSAYDSLHTNLFQKAKKLENKPLSDFQNVYQKGSRLT